jgi:hypothetical protein
VEWSPTRASATFGMPFARASASSAMRDGPGPDDVMGAFLLVVVILPACSSTSKLSRPIACTVCDLLSGSSVSKAKQGSELRVTT